MKCPFCKQRINKYNGYHIYKCDKNKIYKDINIKLADSNTMYKLKSSSSRQKDSIDISFLKELINHANTKI